MEIEWPSSEVMVTGTTFSRTRVFALLTPARLTTASGISLVGLPLLACGECPWLNPQRDAQQPVSGNLRRNPWESPCYHGSFGY